MTSCVRRFSLFAQSPYQLDEKHSIQRKKTAEEFLVIFCNLEKNWFFLRFVFINEDCYIREKYNSRISKGLYFILSRDLCDGEYVTLFKCDILSFRPYFSKPSYPWDKSQESFQEKMYSLTQISRWTRKKMQVSSQILSHYHRGRRQASESLFFGFGGRRRVSFHLTPRTK